MPTADSIPLELLNKAQWVASVCNACRYCEGFCATFPALERRLEFPAYDLVYLANLCHNCGSCYFACQYSPPHEFDVDFPSTMAKIRGVSYRAYAWPGFLAPLFDRPVLATTLLAIALPFAFALGIALLAQPGALLNAYADTEGSFYSVIGHRAMAGLFGVVGLVALLAIVVGVARFWRDSREPFSALLDPKAHRAAVEDALRLRYLGGGDADEGCTYPTDRPSVLRRRFHHLTFYGFLSCFAATSVATLYHYGFGWHAPYPFTSLPVLLGTLGGVALLVGPAGQLWLVARRDPSLDESKQSGMDIAFIALLLLTSATGLALLICRESAGMGLLLSLHLGVVAALFVSMPYGKFVHGFYRYLALLRFALERSRPAPRFFAD